MFRNDIKLALRNMRKNRLDTILNLSGLVLGLALAILILFHIQDELSFDRHFPKAERIFRVSCQMREGNNVRHWATTSPVLPEHLTQSFPEIEMTSRLFAIPARILSYFSENDSPRRFKEANGFFADQTSIDVFDFKFIKGNPKTALTKVNSIVITQSAAERFFPNENPLGKMLSLGNRNKPEDLIQVTGVVENLPSNTHFDFSYIEKIALGILFVYSFLDQDLNRLYDSEQRLSNLFKAFALFAIFISCLGLFGLSSYSAQLRVKEIGIRKTLGASLPSIVKLLSKKYVAWILIANVIALPLGWIYVRDWLHNFAYHTPVGSLPFIITSLLSIGLAFFTVSYHASRAALMNPVASLRYE